MKSREGKWISLRGRQTLLASGNVLYDTGSSKPVLCDNLEGWDGVGGRREVLEGGDICIPMVEPR